MYTVKHIDLNGVERLLSVSSTTFDAKKCELEGRGPAPENAVIARWTAGHAYVMNESGKTVGVYSLNK